MRVESPNHCSPGNFLFSVSCCMGNQWCGSVSTAVLGPSTVPRTFGLLENFRTSDCLPEALPMWFCPLQPTEVPKPPLPTCPPASAGWRPGELFPACLAVLDQLCSDQPGELHHPVGCNHSFSKTRSPAFGGELPSTFVLPWVFSFRLEVYSRGLFTTYSYTPVIAS